MPEGSFELQLAELVTLYVRTKEFVLLAEERDPDSRSNISIFKEQRDAFDHLMRAAARNYSTGGAPESYLADQFSKANGHLYRAAYDALDGLGISQKRRIADTMNGATVEAVKEVFPSYWERLGEIDELEAKIARHRATKDVGSDHTMENLVAYAEDVKRINDIAKECERHAKGIADFMHRQRRGDLWQKIWLPLVVALVAAIVSVSLKAWYDHHGSAPSAAPQRTSPTPAEKE